MPAAGEGWARNPIDRFILARLEKEGLKPSPEADRVTLIRRLYLDLIGLPPTPEEVDAFVADTSAGRLRAARRAAARLARTTASAGAGTGSTRPATPTATATRRTSRAFVWLYRDWVINALNRDLPYDQFIIEQIAGDLLPDATQDQIVATGFLRNSMINEEGGIDPEQFRMEAMFDRMDAIGKGVLGLTVQCAQCHNHKYDPITQDEYYRLFAFLNNDHEAKPRRLHAGRADATGGRAPAGRRGRGGVEAPDARLAASGWHAWEDEVRGEASPSGSSCGRPSRTSRRRGGRSTCRRRTGRSSRRATRPTKQTR